MALTFAQFPAIKAGIWKSPWGRLLRRAGHYASSLLRRIATGKHDVVRAAMRAQGWLPGRNVFFFSDGEIRLKSIVLSATRQPVTHILDWFHLSIRLRHIEQTWEGLRHVQDLNVNLGDVAGHMPRLRHLLWSGYVREAIRTVKHLIAQLDQHPGLRDDPSKLKRLYELLTNLPTYLVQDRLRLSTSADDIGQASPYLVRWLKVPPKISSMPG